MILDTNAVSALFEGDPAIEAILAVAAKHHLPIPVIGEYRYGIIGSRQRQDLEQLLQRLEEKSFLLYPDRDTTRHYAEVRHQLRTIGRPIPENDVWIAALARQHALKIVSRDRHFDNVVGIERVCW